MMIDQSNPHAALSPSPSLNPSPNQKAKETSERESKEETWMQSKKRS